MKTARDIRFGSTLLLVCFGFTACASANRRTAPVVQPAATAPAPDPEPAKPKYPSCFDPEFYGDAPTDKTSLDACVPFEINIKEWRWKNSGDDGDGEFVPGPIKCQSTLRSMKNPLIVATWPHVTKVSEWRLEAIPIVTTENKDNTGSQVDRTYESFVWYDKKGKIWHFGMRGQQDFCNAPAPTVPPKVDPAPPKKK